MHDMSTFSVSERRILSHRLCQVLIHIFFLFTVPQQQQQPLISEPEYVDSRHVKAMKVLNRVQREYEAAVASSTASTIASSSSVTTSASNTLPRNAFSTLEQEKLVAMLQGASSSNISSQNSSGSSRSLGERSKTLGPGFMRGHHHNTVVLLNYHA